MLFNTMGSDCGSPTRDKACTARPGEGWWAEVIVNGGCDSRVGD